ncbi:hypothetical protein U2F26_20560 [Micromonospora sp. 4G57]|uniref:Voltage-gated potassium channel n=1 Tax=Micromonospora sicca TaxID=2202420 RepID=A0ABU5JDV5_9ACTN|nr:MULTISPECIES: hypothetical protein [unclassified Micromonospora]MDZ5445104.1 hypothetical protein [Micromonospora sp. 4G57]MDZ5490777.1 hypothetical protein [Micromonospora sp. 4G53]
MGVLGILFLLVLLGQALAHDQPLATVLTVASWVLWAVFIAEFALRAWLARHTAREFWKRNWWQLIFLAVPFLRFARAATALRAVRGTGVVAAAVRGSRSAGRLLTDRLAWLAVVTLSLILAAGQLLVLTGSYRMYGKALHDVTLTTITGEPLTARHIRAGPGAGTGRIFRRGVRHPRWRPRRLLPQPTTCGQLTRHVRQLTVTPGFRIRPL